MSCSEEHPVWEGRTAWEGCKRYKCRKSNSATLCKDGFKCATCTDLEKKWGYYANPEWSECTECRRCMECTLNLHKKHLPHPTDSSKPGKPTKYYYITRVVNRDGSITKTVVLKKDPVTGKVYYYRAYVLTRSVICDILDKCGLLTTSTVMPPPGYLRRPKYIRRDTPPVPRTSKRPAGHKQETITCPINRCQDRTGMCNCLCYTCMGYSKECECCKRCKCKEGECVCKEED